MIRHVRCAGFIFRSNATCENEDIKVCEKVEPYGALKAVVYFCREKQQIKI